MAAESLFQRDDGDPSSADASASVNWDRDRDQRSVATAATDYGRIFRRDVRTDYGRKTYLATAKKGEKQTFFCRVCRVQLDSLETRLSHVKGQRHRKREETTAEGRQFRRGGEDPVIRIPDPVQRRKRIPVRLGVKIKATREPAVGLRHVTEIIPASDDEIEPYYECSLCDNQGDANGMFNHVLGRKHRGKVFDAEEKTTYELMQMASRYSENDRTDRIVTHISDVMFPWPAGKAPWSIEKGGNGIPPKDAVKHNSAFGKPSEIVPNLPKLRTIGEMNEESLPQMMSFMEMLVQRVLAYEDRTPVFGIAATKALEEAQSNIIGMREAFNFIKDYKPTEPKHEK